LPRGTISAENIWKRFLADKSYAQLRYKLQQIAKGKIRRRGYRWALRDVNMVAEPGESVGLIGANGSGKSTLLKILTRVMYPYAGRVEVGGRVGALIEVAAGIHPDLSGRENVYLYGTLLGLRRSEVARRFDEIVAFAELEEAIDRQVKFYSSGMKMRLGFGVAAFLEPDVLLVDEVLSVGDATFQQKCLNRMRQVLSQGTTLVYVSHDLASVEATCTRGLWLHNGVTEAAGQISDVLASYRRSIEEAAESFGRGGLGIRVEKIEISGPDGQTPATDEPLTIRAIFDNENEDTIGTGLKVFLGISEGTATPIFALRHDVDFPVGETELQCRLPRLPLPRGRFYVWLGVLREKGQDLLPWQPIAHFDVAGKALGRTPRGIVRLAPIYVGAEWQVDRPSLPKKQSARASSRTPRPAAPRSAARRSSGAG
jgi:ABC-type polysaccharide/polyol phosphate transport system ATPase subunit